MKSETLVRQQLFDADMLQNVTETTVFLAKCQLKNLRSATQTRVTVCRMESVKTPFEQCFIMQKTVKAALLH